MRAQNLLPKLVQKSLPAEMHQKRQQTLLALVQASVSAEALTVTGIGRALATTGMTTAKHCIKRADRFLSNPLMHKEVDAVYQQLSALLMRNQGRPVILVDWTEMHHRNAHALVASVPFAGRAQIIFTRVVDQTQLGSPQVQAQFIDALAVILPPGCRPIIVTDAGFQTSWCQAVRKQGWDFVTRVRNSVLFASSAGRWQRVSSLHAQAHSEAQDLGEVTLARSNAQKVRLVVSARPRRGRHAKTLHGTTRNDTNQRKHRKSNSEPWVLSTSISDYAADKVVALYRLRMGIEESFRDAKTTRFGLALEQARGRADRIALLILIAALACFALQLLGAAAERAGAQYAFQANTIRKHRVLSLFRLGLELWRCNLELETLAQKRRIK